MRLNKINNMKTLLTLIAIWQQQKQQQCEIYIKTIEDEF